MFNLIYSSATHFTRTRITHCSFISVSKFIKIV